MRRSILVLSLLVVCGLAFAQSATVYPEGLKVGDKAPEFTAKDQDGKSISLKETLKNGPVVMLFYRGQWCPYCNKQLSHYSDSLTLLKEKGATVLAVTPETDENVKKTISKTKASFSVLEDEGLTIMKSYKVSFAVDEKTVTRYKGYGIDFDKANGSNGANLPVPATYIIGKDGLIKYVFFNTDYKKRASVQDILNNL
ncbi:MAG: peroxiredoxin family protein [Ferruginibacter sp.]